MKYFFFILLSAMAAGCGSKKWTTGDEQQFLGGCIKSSLKDMPEEKARAYCTCMLGKIKARYPDPSATWYLKQDTALQTMVKACKNPN